MMTKSQYTTAVETIKNNLIERLTGLGHEVQWETNRALHVDGTYIPGVEINRYGKPDYWSVRKVREKIEAGSLPEGDEPCCDTVEVIVGRYGSRYDRTRARLKKDGSFDYDKVMEALTDTIQTTKNVEEGAKERHRKQGTISSAMKAHFPDATYGYAHLPNGLMRETSGRLEIDGALNEYTFTVGELAMLARAGTLKFTLVVDGDNVTPELVGLLKEKLGKGDEEEAA